MYRLFRHSIQTGRGVVRARVIKRVHDDVGDLVYTAFVHVVGEIVEMEKPTEEIGADAQLWVATVWVTHRSKFPGLEAVKGTAGSFIQVWVAIEKPSLRFGRDKLVVPVYMEFKGTMGEEIRKQNSRGCRSGGGHAVMTEGVFKERQWFMREGESWKSRGIMSNDDRLLTVCENWSAFKPDSILQP